MVEHPQPPSIPEGDTYLVAESQQHDKGTRVTSTDTRFLLRVSIPHVETLRPIGGFYLLILGMSFLLLPQGQLGVWLQPIWVPGAGLVVAGLASLWLSVVPLPRRPAAAIASLCSLPPLIIAGAYLFLGALPAAATLGFVTLSLILAPFIPPIAPDGPRRPDALGLVFGAAAVVQGLDFLARPDSIANLPAALGMPALPLSLLLISIGLAVVVTQLVTVTPSALYWLAHISYGLTMIGLQAAIAIVVDPLYWVLGAATYLRGASVLILPWLSARAACVDRVAFRPRVALALLTVAILPIAIALPLVIATIPLYSAELATARQVAFGSTLLVMLGASVGGWWLAGSLTAPLTRLMRGVNRIAGGQRGVVLPQQGVTEVVSLTGAVAHMAQTLEARAEERALLLEREQQARERSQEAVRVRDAFLSIAAHELKTPLTALLGQAQLVVRRAAQAELTSARDQRALHTIVEQATRLHRMIDALLDVSHLETGQLQVEQAPMDIAALVRRVSSEIEPTLRTHRLICEVPMAQLLIAGDELRLRQVLENLIGNAVKYSPNGGLVTVRVAVDDRQVMLSVSDEGIGIPRDVLPKLFQPFFRAANVESQRISGIGVGLYVVKEIVSLHGGTVDVRSTEGQGSTFTVRLPLLK